MHPVETQTWTEVFTGMSSEYQWLLLVIAAGCFVGLILGLAGIVASTIGSIQRHQADSALKSEMLDRGMSADEIAKVITASAKRTD